MHSMDKIDFNGGKDGVSLGEIQRRMRGASVRSLQ